MIKRIIGLAVIITVLAVLVLKFAPKKLKFRIKKRRGNDNT